MVRLSESMIDEYGSIGMFYRGRSNNYSFKILCDNATWS
ncbi:MAG: hypothetical protein ACJA01_004207 [Saprospiraceae bacterium]|jgi:hypothetical protein